MSFKNNLRNEAASLRPRRQADERGDRQRPLPKPTARKSAFTVLHPDEIDVLVWAETARNLVWFADWIQSALADGMALSIKNAADGVNVQVILRDDVPFEQSGNAYAAYDPDVAVALVTVVGSFVGLPETTPPEVGGGGDEIPF